MKTTLKLSLVAAALLPLGAQAQLVISDTLSGASSSLDWKALTGACLTAGDGTGKVPACVGLNYYSGKTLVGGTSGRLPDAVGKGALRLTNGDVKLHTDANPATNGNNQTGAVVSNFTFPSNSGVQVTFATVTYGGNGYKNSDGAQSGADGISFFLMDGAQDPNVGGNGGSLGYTCSNGNGVYDGVIGAYVGLGIDEFGNFSNPSDNTSSGDGQKPGSISLRGGGSVAWAALNAKYPTYYPSSLSANDRKSAVQNTCKSGFLYNYSGGRLRDANNNRIDDRAQTTESILNYPSLARSQLPSTSTIYNQEGLAQPKRGDAIPITYALSITQDGLLSLSYSYNGGISTPVITDKSIIASNGPLPSTFRFGFTSGTGGGSNVHEITCFKAAQINETGSSAGSNTQQGSRVEAGTQIYLALYHPTGWWGQLTAQSLLEDPTTHAVTIKQQSNWDASCVLTGGTCTATKGTNTVQASGDRAILSWSGSAGIPFQWGQLTSAQQTALGEQDRLNYLRGDRSNEVTTSGTGKYRVRKGVLGDIINSSPAWVGYPQANNKGPWKDSLNTSATPAENATTAQTYATFITNNATRTNVVYVGANDGMLHGFRAGAFGTDLKFNSASTNDGRELLAYVPGAVVSTIHSGTAKLDYSSTQYAHNAFVDATVGTGDVFYNNAWHTWAVGGLGGGGNAGGEIGDNTSTATGVLYALDVTNPTNFSEANASSLVIGEWTSSTLLCTGEVAATAVCKTNLGSVVGTPIFRRLHDGKWAAIFGNGLNSSTGTAGIFIMTIDPTNGGTSFRFLDTGSKPATAGAAKNGITQVAGVDLDGDRVIDYVYGGDLYGNMWRFDLTSATPSSWSASASPLFAAGSGKPITTSPVVTAVSAATGAPRVLVAFGTGRKINQTLTTAETYASGTQSMYGIWDWDMASWNGKSTTKYAALTGTNNITATTLTTQTATDYAATVGNISGIRTLTRNAVCWKGSTDCGAAAGSNTKYGWTVDLPVNTEQITFNPVYAFGMVIVNTIVPASEQALSCSRQAASGFTMAFAPDAGAPAASPFNTTTGNYAPANGNVVAGIGISAVGSPTFVTSGSGSGTVTTMINNTGTASSGDSSGNGSGGGGNSGGVNGTTNPLDIPGAGIGKRLTWLKKR